MQVDIKTFVADILIEETSSVCLVCSLKLLGIKFSITANAFCFLAVFFVITSYISSCK